MTPRNPSARHQTLEIDGAALEIFEVGGDEGKLSMAAAHPTDVFGADTANLLASVTHAHVVCINSPSAVRPAPAQGTPLEEMVDRIEAARRRLALPSWVFWGMSGGGWLAQIYAHRHPEALKGIIVESACVSFRARLADPACVLSPFFPAWREALEARGLLSEGVHSDLSAADDATWIDVQGAGQVLRRPDGPALLVSPMPIDENMKQTMPQLWRFDARAWVKDLRVPTLVIAGAADPVVPVHRVREVYESIPNSRFVLIPEGGHVPSVGQHAAAVAAVRSFLAELRHDDPWEKTAVATTEAW